MPLDSDLKIQHTNLYRGVILREIKEPFIVGIDPGTTTALALVNLEGELLELKSGKNLSDSRIRRFISEIGNPIIIATDISSPPKKVEKISSSFSSRLFYPEEDLKRELKEDLTRHYEEVTNKHEKDALASALYALKRINPLVNKVKQELEREGKENLYKKVSKKVLLNRKSIRSNIKEVLKE